MIQFRAAQVAWKPDTASSILAKGIRCSLTSFSKLQTWNDHRAVYVAGKPASSTLAEGYLALSHELLSMADMA